MSESAPICDHEPKNHTNFLKKYNFNHDIYYYNNSWLIIYYVQKGIGLCILEQYLQKKKSVSNIEALSRF